VVHFGQPAEPQHGALGDADLLSDALIGQLCSSVTDESGAGICIIPLELLKPAIGALGRRLDFDRTPGPSYVFGKIRPRNSCSQQVYLQRPSMLFS
jgi:hypothetical protein